MMNYCGISWLLLLANLISYATCFSAADDESDPVLTDVRYLYEKPTHYVDLNDMPADFNAPS